MVEDGERGEEGWGWIRGVWWRMERGMKKAGVGLGVRRDYIELKWKLYFDAVIRNTI